MSIWSISYKDKEGVYYVSFLLPPIFIDATPGFEWGF